MLTEDKFQESVAEQFSSVFEQLAVLNREVIKKETIALFDPVPDLGRHIKALREAIENGASQEDLDKAFGIRWKLGFYIGLATFFKDYVSSRGDYISLDNIRIHAQELLDGLPPYVPQEPAEN